MSIAHFESLQQMIERLGHFGYKDVTDEVKALTWSPDGKYLAFGGNDSVIYVCHASTGHIIFVYKGHADRVNSITWSPDNKYIASGSADRTVQVWRVGEQKPDQESFLLS